MKIVLRTRGSIVRVVMTAAILFALAHRINAAPLVVYIAPEPVGMDGAEGTREKPVASIREALKRVTASPEGGRVILRGGRYLVEESISADSNSSSPDIVLEADKGELPILDGSISTQDAKQLDNSPGVYVIHRSFGYQPPEVLSMSPRHRYRGVANVDTVRAVPGTCTLIDENTLAFHVADGQTPAQANVRVAVQRFGLLIHRPHVSVRGIRFENYVLQSSSSGIDLRGADGVIEDCQFFNCVAGVRLNDETERPRVSRCRLEQCDTGIFCGARSALIENNQLLKIRDNTVRDDTDIQDDTGILVYSPAKDVTLRGNVTRGYVLGFFIKTGETPALVEHNTFFDGMGVNRPRYKRLVIRRNVINVEPTRVAPNLADDLTQLAPTSRIENNLFFTRDDIAKSASARPVKVEIGEGNSRGTPNFIDACSSDFRLQPDSAAVKLADEAGPAGALPVVQNPPGVKASDWDVSLDAPAVALGKDSLLAPSLTEEIDLRRRWDRTFRGEQEPAVFATTQRKVRLRITSLCGVSESKVGDVFVSLDGAKSTRLEKDFTITLVDTRGVQRVAVSMGDMTRTLFILSAGQPAKISGQPSVRATSAGAVVTFRSDEPASAVLKFKNETVAAPLDVERIWDIESGDETVTARRLLTLDHAVKLVQFDSGKPLRFRVKLTDALGRESTSEEYTLTTDGAKPATRLHVAPKGVDEAGRGTTEKPFASIQYAVDRALPGDTVHLAPGVYCQRAVIQTGGTANAPLIIEGDDARTTAIDGLRLTPNLLLLENAPHVYVRNLGLRWFGLAGVHARSSSDLHLESCRMINHSWAGYAMGYGLFCNESPGAVATSNIVSRVDYGLFFYRSPGARIEHNTGVATVHGGVALMIGSFRDTVMLNNALCFNASQQLRIAEYNLTLDQLKEIFRTTTFDHNNYATVVGEQYFESYVKSGYGKVAIKPIKPGKPYLPIESKGVININENSKDKWISDPDQWRTLTGQDAHSIYEDPKFIEPWLDRWEVEPTSPNLKAGSGGTTIGALGSLK